MSEQTPSVEASKEQKSAQAGPIQIIPIVVGLVVDIIGTFVFGALVGVLITISLGIADAAEAQRTLTSILATPFVMGALTVVGFLFSMLGGYIASRMAKTKKLFHSEILGYVVIVIGLLTSVLPPLAAGNAIPVNLAISTASFLLSFFVIGIGGRFAAQSDTDSPGLLAKIFVVKKVSLTHAAAVVGALVLVVSFAGAYLQKDNLSCTVETIYVYGTLYTTPPVYTDETSGESLPETYSAGLAEGIEALNKNDKVKAILVEVDSAGGNPVAGEEIANALKRTDKHVVVYVRSMAASAAYWAISSADIIFASSNADVGGIGVSVNYLDSYEKNRREGLNSNIISSAKYKTLGDPNLPLTHEQREIIQRDVDEIHNNFVSAVAENRNLDKDAVEKIADGATMLGSRALENKLIDRIGDMVDAKKYLEEFLGEEPRICTSLYPEG